MHKFIDPQDKVTLPHPHLINPTQPIYRNPPHLLYCLNPLKVLLKIIAFLLPASENFCIHITRDGRHKWANKFTGRHVFPMVPEPRPASEGGAFFIAKGREDHLHINQSGGLLH